MPTITFQDAEEFAEFVASQPALGDAAKCVFLSEESRNQRNYNGRYYHSNTVSFAYHALVPVVEMEAFVHANLDLNSHLPQEWATMNAKGLLDYRCNTKKELVEFLKAVEVKDSEIKKLNKTTVSTLKEIVDNSPTNTIENEDFEEIVFKLKSKGDVVELTSAKYGKVKLLLTKEGNQNLVYRLSSDWGTSLAALMKTVETALKKHKLKCVHGNVVL